MAQIVAFDGPARPPVGVDDLLGKPAAKLRLAIQPYVTLLELKYPLDDYVIQLKQHGLRRDASNAIEESDAPARTNPPPPIAPASNRLHRRAPP